MKPVTAMTASEAQSTGTPRGSRAYTPAISSTRAAVTSASSGFRGPCRRSRTVVSMNVTFRQGDTCASWAAAA